MVPQLSTRPEHRSRGVEFCGEPNPDEELGTQLDRDLVEPRLARLAAQVSDGFAGLDGVAGGGFFDRFVDDVFVKPADAVGNAATTGWNSVKNFFS